MSNRGKKLGNHNQIGLFEMILKSESKNPKEGSLNIQADFRRILSQCVSESKYSVYQIAARMSEYLNLSITHHMIYSWTALSKDGYRIPAEFIPAFCYGVESFKPIEFLGHKTDRYLLPGAEALRSEIQRIEEQIESLQNEKSKRLFFLDEVNKK